MRAHLANAEKFAYVVALVRFEKAIDAHLFQVTLSEVARGITRVELRVGPHVTHALHIILNHTLTCKRNDTG